MGLNNHREDNTDMARRNVLKGLLFTVTTTVAGQVLTACGGSGTTEGDKTPEVTDTTLPKIDTFAIKNGSALTANPDASYSVAGNLGTTQEYTISFDEKLDASEYTVQMLDANNTLVALPTGITATLIANDASNTTYTLQIVTDGKFVFDAGQASKDIKLQFTVVDVASNKTPVNLTQTVNDVAPTAPADSAFAKLADITIGDQAGFGTLTINAGGVTDPLGRTIVYFATGLPAGLTIDSTTGVISGVHDALDALEPYSIIVTASATGSTQYASKSFIFSIRNDG